MKSATQGDVRELFYAVVQARQKLVQALRSQAHRVSDSYVFSAHNIPQLRLSDLFAGRSDLLVVHNMGTSCLWCTLWADGLNGLHRQLESRCAIVIMSADSPSAQKQFAEGRGWTIPMICDHEGTFTSDMGFAEQTNGRWNYMPGVSAFARDTDGTITRVASDAFGPGDVYMPVYHLFDLLRDGQAGWKPQYTYNKPIDISLP